MARFKIFSTFMVLFLIQSSLAKSIENTSNSVESSEESFLTPKQTIAVHVVDNYRFFGSKYAEKSLEFSRKMLQDQDLMANENPEVVEFKKDLITCVESFDDKHNTKWDVIDFFFNVTYHYLELLKEKETPESIFIVKILNKYRVNEIEEDFKKDFDSFVETFKGKFEKVKKDLNKPLWDWYEKFLTITDFQEKFNSFAKFLDLI